jgi:Fe2+ or Zn2+ uptake regulation protein
VCDQCGGVEDLAWFDLPRQSGQAELGGHSIRSYEVIFRGTCRRCTSKSAGAR